MIEKKVEGTELSDILIEAGLIGSGSVMGLMTGKHYSRAMHCNLLSSVLVVHLLVVTKIQPVQVTPALHRN
jgi:hypothetical protein